MVGFTDASKYGQHQDSLQATVLLTQNKKVRVRTNKALMNDLVSRATLNAELRYGRLDSQGWWRQQLKAPLPRLVCLRAPLNAELRYGRSDSVGTLAGTKCF